MNIIFYKYYVAGISPVEIGKIRIFTITIKLYPHFIHVFEIYLLKIEFNLFEHINAIYLLLYGLFRNQRDVEFSQFPIEFYP